MYSVVKIRIAKCILTSEPNLIENSGVLKVKQQNLNFFISAISRNLLLWRFLAGKLENVGKQRNICFMNPFYDAIFNLNQDDKMIEEKCSHYNVFHF